MTVAPTDARPGWSSGWRRLSYWALAVVGLPIMTASWCWIWLWSEEATRGTASDATRDPSIVVMFAPVVAAHVIGAALLGGIAHGAPGSSRRRAVRVVATVAVASVAGLVTVLLLTGGHLIATHPRPPVP